MAIVGFLGRDHHRGARRHRAVPVLLPARAVDPDDRGRRAALDRLADPHADHRRAGRADRREPGARAQGGPALTVDQLQSHILAGGNVDKVTLAMIAAQRAQIPLEWQRAAAIDLAGRDVLEALQTSVNPKVIETPIFQGVAQNGIQLNVKARITVRSNLDRYVGGAGEPTIVARVGEGVVSAVGAAIDHKEVLGVPRPHLEGRAREGARRRHRVRDRLDRHRRRRRRQEHRRRPADLAGRSRPPHRAGQGGRTAVRRAGGRAGA